MNSITTDGPLYLFSANLDSSHQAMSWYLDSGASQHMSPLKFLFRNFQELSSPCLIILGDNSTHNVVGYGSIVVQLSNSQQLQFLDVLYILSSAKNLLSVAQIINTSNTKVTFCRDYCFIMTTSPINHKSITYKTNKEGGLFSLGSSIEPPISNNLAITKPDLETK